MTFEVGTFGGVFSVTMERVEPWREYLRRLGGWVVRAALLLESDPPPRRRREPVGPAVPVVVDRHLSPDAWYLVAAWPPEEPEAWAVWREAELRMHRMLVAILAGTYDDPPRVVPPF